MFLQNLGLALLLGSLIGLERERDRHAEDTHEFGGIRTLSLISVLGYLSFQLFADTIMFAVLTAGFFLLVIASYLISSYQNKNSGATTEIAGIFTFLIGVLMGMEETLIASVITLIVVTLLYFKQALHAFAHKIAQEELYDTIKFIAVVFVVLPLLPNQSYGPLGAINPYEIWLMIVLISTISFASYLGIKALGSQKGIGLGGFLGGLISSTAVALSFSALSKKTPKTVNPFVFAILLASSAMFFRVLFTVSVLNPDLTQVILIPMLAMGLLGFGIAAYFWYKPDSLGMKKFSAKDLNLHSPFQLWPAVKFGLIFASFLFISRFAAEYFGERGVYFTAFFSGIFDVDAITISMVNLHKSDQITTIAAGAAIIIATLTNTLSKGFIVLFFGSRGVGLRVLCALFIIAAFGLAVLFAFVPEYYGLITI